MFNNHKIVCKNKTQKLLALRKLAAAGYKFAGGQLSYLDLIKYQAEDYDHLVIDEEGSVYNCFTITKNVISFKVFMATYK